MNDLRVMVWNTEWARSHTPRGEEINRLIAATEPDLVCVTEGFADLLPDHGNVVDSDPDYGYRQQEGRRKVLLWSREPWEDVDRIGDPEMPTGRFVKGVTNTRLGPMRVVGVCIPWRDAHVRTGRKDRAPWEDHRRFLSGLGSILDRQGPVPALVVGDFNQRIPRFRTPKAVFQDLIDVFESQFSVCTSGELPGAEDLSIDHVAHTEQLRPTSIAVIPKVSEQGLRLSDHFGLKVDFRIATGSHKS